MTRTIIYTYYYYYYYTYRVVVTTVNDHTIESQKSFQKIQNAYIIITVVVHTRTCPHTIDIYIYIGTYDTHPTVRPYVFAMINRFCNEVKN